MKQKVRNCKGIKCDIIEPLTLFASNCFPREYNLVLTGKTKGVHSLSPYSFLPLPIQVYSNFRKNKIFKSATFFL